MQIGCSSTGSYPSTGAGTTGEETGCDGDSRDEADTVPVREDAMALIVSAKVVE